MTENIRGRAQGPLHTSELVDARKAKRKYTQRTFKPLSIGPKTHPVLKWIFATMNEKTITIASLEKTSGVPRGTLFHWRGAGSNPSFLNIEAVVEALGGRIVVEVLPQPNDLEQCKPPGHALPAKALTPALDLQPLSPRAIKAHGPIGPGAAPKPQDDKPTRDPSRQEDFER